MKISLNWIKQYVSIPDNLSAKELALKLTMSTVEVDGYENQGKNLDNIIVGQIINIKPHPNADRLRLVDTKISNSEIKQLVCGGSNLKEGMLVVVAVPGTRVKWHGEGDLVELQLTEIRGEKSYGMICAADEIGLKDVFPKNNEKEIVDLGRFAKESDIGQPIAKVLNLDDVIFEIDNKSMTNRPDLWGHYGMAREIAALYNLKLKKYTLKEFDTENREKINIQNDDQKICSRYLAISLENISVKESPEWLKNHLLAVGLKPINNIVDITNYVMLDIGQPMHAFDADTLISENNQKTIKIRQAQNNEKITALDGNEYTLNSQMTVIADAKKPIALAGIIGGKDSSITEKTTKIILESANFDGNNIRKTALNLSLRTDSSSRFEKNLDLNNAELAIKKAVNLILKLEPKAKISSTLYDVSKFELSSKPIELEFDFLDKKIGAIIDKKIIINILKSLGFGVAKNKNDLSVRVPSWRNTGDISIKDDLVEEISRIYGYDNITPIAPIFPIIPPEVNNLRNLENKIRDILSLHGSYSEVLNYSFVSEKQIKNLGDDVEKYMELGNPISKEKPFVIRNLTINLLENVKNNLEFNDKVKLFEIGKTFIREEKGDLLIPTAKISEKNDGKCLPLQDVYLTVVYSEKGEADPFNAVLSILEIIFLSLKRNFRNIKAENLLAWQHPERSADILESGKKVGSIYEIHPKTQEQLDLKAKTACLELNLTALQQAIDQNTIEVKFTPIPQFPEIIRDISFIVSNDISHQLINDMLVKFDTLIYKIELIDIYKGKNIKENHKNMTYRLTYLNPNKTLTADEVEQVHIKLKNKLKSQFSAEIRE